MRYLRIVLLGTFLVPVRVVQVGTRDFCPGAVGKPDQIASRNCGSRLNASFYGLQVKENSLRSVIVIDPNEIAPF